jgi:Chaperone of endosialidase
MNDMADGLGFAPRVKEPESALEPGMAAPAPRKAVDALFAPGALSMPDTSGPGSVAAPSPATWVYDFDPANGVSRATFNGEVSFTSGGSATAGVTSFNTRTGAVVLTAGDLSALNAVINPSPTLAGVPNAPTAAPGTSTTQIATCQFVAQAIVANPIVQSFNGRTGAVTLTSGDVTGAGGAPAASPALTGVPTTPTASQGTASSQIASTQFVSNAIASGTVTSWNGRQGAVSLTLSDVQSVGGAPIASPTFTGVPAVPTATPGTATTQAASTAFVTNAVSAGTAGVASFNTRTGAVVFTAADLASVGGAPLNSPTFTGNPAAPTPTAGDSSTKLATTAFVGTAIASLPAGVATFNGRSGTVTLTLADVTSVGGAPLASPVFTGTPQGTTATPGDNSIRLATTAFVTAACSAIAIPAPSGAAPLMDGTAAAGSLAAWARGDHVHPTDTSRYAASNPSGYQTAAQVTASLGNYVPLAGNVIITNPLTIQAGSSPNALSLTLGAGNITMLSLYDSAGGNDRADFYYDHTNQQALIRHNPAATYLVLNSSGGFTYQGGSGVASKAGGGSWTATSDARIKTILGDYKSGLEEVIKLAPVVYRYKGNDATIKGEASPHAKAAADQTPFVGLIAQAAETAMPELVKKTSGVIDGVEVDDLRTLDTTPLIFALVNAVKTLAQRVNNLERALHSGGQG